MPQALKMTLNGVVVVALTYAGILLMLQLPGSVLSPVQWVGERADPAASLAFLFAYTILSWAVIGAGIAGCMLLLKPRLIFLYGLISAATFVVTLKSWSLVLDGNAYGYLRELVFILTIPYLYWIFVRMANRRARRAEGAVQEAPESQ